MNNKNYIKHKIRIIFLIISLFFSFGINTTISFNLTIVNDEEYKINRGEVFNFYAGFFEGTIPESYKYINLNFKDINKDSELYISLQKLVYLDLIKNSNSKVFENKEISVYNFYKLSEKIFDISIITPSEINNLKETDTNINHLDKVEDIINNKQLEITNRFFKSKNEIEVKKAIFGDIYSTILNNHYDKNNLDEKEMINSAIEGLAKGTDDKHTVYFPPIETKNFYESLNGEYEGIGAYVDMETPGVFKILSPIKDSPSQKAGLKGGDRVLKVDGVEIKKENSLKEVISWIKGPKGTNVVLTIERGEEIFGVTVTRDKIVINDVEFESFGSDTFYIEIKSFGENVSSDFEKAMETLTGKKRVKKVIIDLRNNGGGYLGQVTNMLSYFVAKDEVTAHVKYLDSSMNYYSKGYNTVDFSKYEIVILQNSGTASASEIMIGTIKDYYPETEIIGEKSYGKGSVQTIKSYKDGSTFKYTVAKWFTGKTQTGIDQIGIEPTIELEFDLDMYNNTGKDNQLEKARDI